MRFIQYEYKGTRSLGVELVENGDIVDISAVDESIPSNMRHFLEGGSPMLLKAQRALETGKCIISRAEVRVLAPLDNPDKVLCVGMNYKDHCAELKVAVPTEPSVIFSKFSSCIVGTGDSIPYPKITEQLDWEGELVIVIGKIGKEIPEDKAMDYIFGYTIALDVTATDWLKLKGSAQQILLAKSMAGFCPLGPTVVMKESLTDPHNLSLKTSVNGELKQDGNTNQLIFKTDYLVSYLSKFFTLYPGDIILTGTPAGTGLSFKPPQFLKPGDVVKVEIESIGSITNTVA